jgi:hypothetical protein
MNSDCDPDRRRQLRTLTASAFASTGAERTGASPEDHSCTPPTSYRLPCRRRSAPRPGNRKSIPVVLAAMVLLVSGCGQQGDAGSSPAPRTSLPATSATPHKTTDSQSNATPTRGAARAMGVDTAQWPGTLAAAKPLFARMPREIAGMAAHYPDYAGNSVGVTYGPSADGAEAYVMGTDNEVKDPTAVLSFMFGMGFACKKGSYAGTAPPSRYGGGPDIDFGGAYDPKNQAWWFTCIIDGTEGDPTFTGHALGWVSGDLAWLVTTPDETTTETLVTAMLASG